MRKSLESTIIKTFNEFNLAHCSRYDFVDICSSLLAWIMLPRLTEDGEYARPTLPLYLPGTCRQLTTSLINSRVVDTKNEFLSAMDQWQRENPLFLQGLLEIDLRQFKDLTLRQWDAICEEWIELFADIDPENNKKSFLRAFDSLEDALTIQMEPSEVHTPREVAAIMIEFAKERSIQSIYDPYSRAGDQLAAAAANLGELKKVRGLTQTKILRKMSVLRLLINESLEKITIEKGSILNVFPDKEKFDFIILNPPFGVEYDRSRLLEPEAHERWRRMVHGSNRQDIAYLGHALDQLSDNGSASIVLPNIMLSGQGILRHLRAEIIKENLLEGVIILPPKIFYNTGVSTVIFLLRKARQTKDVFILDASDMVFKKDKQYLLDVEKVKALLEGIRGGNTIQNDHIQQITTDDIASKNYDLQFSLYDKKVRMLPNLIKSSQEILQTCMLLEKEIAEIRARITTKINEQSINLK